VPEIESVQAAMHVFGSERRHGVFVCKIFEYSKLNKDTEMDILLKHHLLHVKLVIAS